MEKKICCPKNSRESQKRLSMFQYYNPYKKNTNTPKMKNKFIFCTKLLHLSFFFFYKTNLSA